MDKKLEYHKEYSEAAYKDRVYKWFNDNTSTLSDLELQKFVDLCMRGNLTFQCADEIDIDEPDISMIDHLLMDIASEKNNELINTYTDEIDWDNNYLENCAMNKKLESRVAKLEKLANEKFGYTAKESMKALDHCYDVISQVEQSFKRGLGMHSGLDEEHTVNTINAIEGLLNIIKKYYLSSY